MNIPKEIIIDTLQEIHTLILHLTKSKLLTMMIMLLLFGEMNMAIKKNLKSSMTKILNDLTWLFPTNNSHITINSINC